MMKKLFLVTLIFLSSLALRADEEYRLLYALSNQTITTTGTNYNLQTLLGSGVEADAIHIENTGAVTDVYVGFDRDRISVNTDGDTNPCLRVRAGSSAASGTFKTRPVRCRMFALKTAADSTTVDIEVYGK